MLMLLCTHVQTVEEKYCKKKMEMQTCKLMHISDWKRIQFHLRLNPGSVDGWGIHLDEDKVERCFYNHVYLN